MAAKVWIYEVNAISLFGFETRPMTVKDTEKLKTFSHSRLRRILPTERIKPHMIAIHFDVPSFMHHQPSSSHI